MNLTLTELSVETHFAEVVLSTKGATQITRNRLLLWRSRFASLIHAKRASSSLTSGTHRHLPGKMYFRSFSKTILA